MTSLEFRERAVVLLNATRKLLELQKDSYYVLNLLDETVFYDDTDCDGYCLMDDIDYLLDENIEEELSKKIKTGKWIPFEQYGKTTAHYCSSCENPVKIRTFFCPYCGADMRAEDGEP